MADYDTKANLLYKLGNIKEAIIWQQSAVIVDLENKDKQGEQRKPLSENEFYITLNKMKAGEQTWVVKKESLSVALTK